jgi:ABC-type branched-subunit amino acid transport system ATPase component
MSAQAAPISATREADAAATALEAVEVSKHFGGVRALRGVSLRLQEGAIIGLIGPNGSGKTTLLNCFAGVYAPTSGSILLDGRSIDGWPAHAVARAGIVRTFQNIRLFAHLTSRQNVEVSALSAGRVKRRASRGYALEMLAELGIAHLAEREAGTLSYGDQRRLEVARALAARPRFLLLDEPAAGMSEAESEELRGSLDRIRAQRECGILVVEHDLRLIMELCDTIQVLNEGEVISQGTPDAIRRDPAVIAAYIGEEEREVRERETREERRPHDEKTD